MKTPRRPTMGTVRRYQKVNGIYLHMQSHVTNQPWSICKGEKKKLEAIKWPPFTYFRIVAVTDPTQRKLKDV